MPFKSMALINCKECKREISNKAKACPHCGAKVSRSVWLPAILGFFALGIVGSLLPENTPMTQASDQPLQEDFSDENSLPHWQPPAGFTLATVKTGFSESGTVGFRWVPSESAQCKSYQENCTQIEIVSPKGCNSLYVSASFIDDSDRNVGYTNDTTNNLAPNQIAQLTLNAQEGSKMQLSEINCY
jgi:hypothetical protein